MAKSLYSALFDWIVFRTNHALLNNKDLEDNSKVREEKPRFAPKCDGSFIQGDPKKLGIFEVRIASK